MTRARGEKNMGREQVPVGIVVPGRNAAATLRPTLARIPVAQLDRLRVRAKLYLVDDGSRDGTREVMRRVEAVPPPGPLPAVVLVHAENRGYGAALKTGLAASLAEGNRAHVQLHSDGQYAPEELPSMLAPILQDRADVVIGSKFLLGHVLEQGMPLARMLGLRLADALENAVFGLEGLEYHSGYMAYSSAALERIPFETLTDKFHFDGQMVLSAGKASLAIARVPIRTSYAPGSSSLAPVPYLGEILATLLAYGRGKFWFQEGR
jgi:glycosyltransferase involved in cell wall biosynthesis